VGFISAASAQNVYTPPVGFITQNMTTAGYSYVSLGLATLPVASGTVAACVPASNSFYDNAANWANDNFSNGLPYEVEFTVPLGGPTNSYPNAGLIDGIKSFTNPGTVNTLGDDSSFISAGYTYLIRPSWTPNTAFGTPANCGLNGGANGNAADNVYVWNNQGQNTVAYWYKTSGPITAQGWRGGPNSSASVDQGTNALFTDGGLVVFRRAGTTPTNLVLVGGVKLGQTMVAVNPGPNNLTFAGYVYASSLSMTNLGLFTGSTATGLQGGANGNAADNVYVWNPAGQNTIAYWYKTSGPITAQGWRGGPNNSASVDQGTNVLAIGSVLEILRRSGPLFDWFAPQPY